MVRRQIKVQLPNSQAGMAALGMLDLRPNYSLSALEISELNPRRVDLDAAGATVERMRKLAIQPGESEDDWLKRVEAELSTLNLTENDREEWDALIALSQDIRRKKGVLQPIVAVTDPQRPNIARIVAGERRFLASHLANMNGVHVLLQRYDVAGDANSAELEETRDRFVENLLRKNLSLRGLVNGLSLLQSKEGRSFSVGELQKYTGFSRGKAYMLFQVLALPVDHPVRQEIERSEITTLNQAITRLTPEKKTATPSVSSVVEQGAPAEDESRSNLNASDLNASDESSDEPFVKMAADTSNRSNLNTQDTKEEGDSTNRVGEEETKRSTEPSEQARKSTASKPRNVEQEEVIATLKSWCVTAIEKGNHPLTDNEREILIARLDDANSLDAIAVCADMYCKMIEKTRHGKA